MSNHTPGTWEVDNTDATIEHPLSIEAWEAGRSIAAVAGQATPEEMLANAYLLAAAPALLAACKSAVAHGCTLREMHEAIA